MRIDLEKLFSLAGLTEEAPVEKAEETQTEEADALGPKPYRIISGRDGLEILD